ncbi:MAG: hypothetical protein AAGG48_26590 [Planctomycetota bacterium]
MTALDFKRINGLETPQIERWILDRLVGIYDFPLHPKKDPNPVGIFAEIVESGKSSLATRERVANALLGTLVKVLVDREAVNGVELRTPERVTYLAEAVSFACPFASTGIHQLTSRVLRDELVSPSFGSMDDAAITVGRCYLSFDPIEPTVFWHALAAYGGDWEKIALQGLSNRSTFEALTFMGSLNYPESLMRVLKLTSRFLIKKHGLNHISDQIEQHFRITENAEARIRIQKLFGIVTDSAENVTDLLGSNTKIVFSSIVDVQQRTGRSKLLRSTELSAKHILHVSPVFKDPLSHFDSIREELGKSLQRSFPGRNASSLAPTPLAAACLSVDPVFWLLTGMVFRFPNECDSLNGWALDIDAAKTFASRVESRGTVLIGRDHVESDFLQETLRSFYVQYGNFFYGAAAKQENSFVSLSPLLASLISFEISDSASSLHGFAQ